MRLFIYLDFSIERAAVITGGIVDEILELTLLQFVFGGQHQAQGPVIGKYTCGLRDGVYQNFQVNIRNPYRSDYSVKTGRRKLRYLSKTLCAGTVDKGCARQIGALCVGASREVGDGE